MSGRDRPGPASALPPARFPLRRTSRAAADESPPRRGTLSGTVVEQLPSALYRVRLDEGGEVTAHIADRIDRNFVRVLVGDRVHVELAPVDAGRGRITARL